MASQQITGRAGSLIGVCHNCSLLIDIESLWHQVPRALDEDRLLTAALTEIYLALRHRADQAHRTPFGRRRENPNL